MTDSNAPIIGTSRRTISRVIVGSGFRTVIGSVVGFLAIPLVLDALGPERYGAWIALSTIATIGSLADAGVRTEVVRRTASALGGGDLQHIARIANEGTTAVALVAGTAVVSLSAAAPFIVAILFPGGVAQVPSSELLGILWTVLALAAVNIVASVHFAALSGIQRGDIEASLRAVASPIGVAAMLIALYSNLGLWAFVLGQLVTAWIVYGGLFLRSRQLLPALRLRLVRPQRALLRDWMTMSTLALFTQLSDVVDAQWDKLVLARVVTLPSVAAYHIGTSLVNQLRSLSLVVLAPLLSGTAELARSNPRRAELLFHRSVAGAQLAGLTAMGTTFVFGPRLLNLWLDQAPRAGGVARFFALAMAVNLMSAPLTVRAFGEQEHRLVALSAALNMALNAIASLALAMTIGTLGVVYGSIIGNTAGVILMIAMYQRRRSGRRLIPPITPPILVVGLCAAALPTGMADVDSIPIGLLRAGVFSLLLATACALPLQRYLRRTTQAV